MLIGYMRISKADGTQNFNLQKDALFEAGVDIDRIYYDMASGKKDDRPGLVTCLKALQPGNTLVVWKLDRLGRNLKDLVTIIEDLTKRDIGFKILTGSGAHIDTTTPSGRMIFGIFATLAEFERDLTVERTMAGLAAARARGRKGGRPRKMDRDMLKIVVAAMSDCTTVVTDLAKKLKLTPTTLYHYVNGDGSLKEEGRKLMQTTKT